MGTLKCDILSDFQTLCTFPSAKIQIGLTGRFCQDFFLDQKSTLGKVC